MSRRQDGVLLVACSALYLAVATRVTGGLGRTQFDNRAYADFFDIQAEALLSGHLALPVNSIGAEAFVVDGREQMYFGLFPAVLRLPITVATDAFSGQLTVVSSLFAWLLFVLSAWALADRAIHHLLQGRYTTARRRLMPVWKVGIALGTPLMMLAGPVWVFSEAILWGVASCTWVQYRLFCELEMSSARNQSVLGAALLLAVLNRPTLGLGCLLIVGAVLLVRIWRQRSAGPAEYRVAGYSMAALGLLVVPNMIRFGRPFGPPMELQVLSQVDEQRKKMLEYAGGDFVDPRYLPTNLLTYLRPDGITLSEQFPFFDAPHQLPHVFGGAVYDITYRTPSLPASTPFLFGLAVLGIVLSIASMRHQPATRWLLLASGAGLPAAATLMVWGFIAPRYLADFVATLLPLSIVGLAGIIGIIGRCGNGARRWLLALGVLVVGWSVTANISMALSSSYLTGPDGGVGELVKLQQRSDYWTSDATVRHDNIEEFSFERTNPPPVGQIAVLDECAGAWFSNGEPVDPWITLGYGPSEFRRVFSILVEDSAETALSVPLATFANASPSDPGVPNTFELSLLIRADKSFALNLADEFGIITYDLHDVQVGRSFDLALTSDPVRRSMFFEIDGETVAFGHVFTRSLYGPDGQTIKFIDSASQDGLRIVKVAPTRCPQFS